MKETTFSYRGFMLDSVRHFMPVEEVRKIIRGARICGMNRMHWHLTDDQGWRIEIRKYPKLTAVGAVRGRSFFGGVSETENNNGYYTQDEIREMVRFAGENGMEVIPEIEIPGHASALLAAYPEYGCRRITEGADGKEKPAEPWTYAVETAGGIFPNLICPGKESTIRFAEDILEEVTDLFPGRMIHLGGDEALKLHWRRCPDCREKMRRKGFSNEDALQRDLILHLGAFLAERGRETVVWSDVLDGGMLPPYFVVQQWLGGEEQVRQFMQSGGSVICSDIRVYYFDYPYGSSDIRKIWQAPRIPDWAAGMEDRLLGLECPLWTERVTNADRAAFLLFPRLAAAGLKAMGKEEPWESFLEEVREKDRQIRALGLSSAPEDMWDMPEDRAKKDRQADRDRIYAPEAKPFVFLSEQLTLLEKTERLMREIGIPDAFAQKAGDQRLAELYGKPKETEDDGAGKLILQLEEAVESREYGAWKRIPAKIWLDTMKCYPRFIAEHRRSYGRDGFDRGEWTVRQAGCRLFRIGELEYELAEENGGKVVSLHIPSDARLEPDLLNDSLRQAKEFLEQYYPEWKDLPFVCESWLLSPVLKNLLPPGSRIRRFQDAFDLVREEPDDMAALEWVFGVAEGQRGEVRYEALPENTSL